APERVGRGPRPKSGEIGRHLDFVGLSRDPAVRQLFDMNLCVNGHSPDARIQRPPVEELGVAFIKAIFGAEPPVTVSIVVPPDRRYTVLEQLGRHVALKWRHRIVAEINPDEAL